MPFFTIYDFVIPDFNNTELAFAHKTDKELLFSYRIFKMMQSPFLVNSGSQLAAFTLKLGLPVGWIIKKTIYTQFCGGETIEECKKTAKSIASNNVKVILDYSVEARETDAEFNQTVNELKQVIREATNNESIPFSCLKLTGIARNNDLINLSLDTSSISLDNVGYNLINNRLLDTCSESVKANCPLYIDAEESWIQPAIDYLCEEMIFKFNKEKALVFTTIQMYRTDRLEYMKELINKCRERKVKCGIKLVRGAYMEKERERAEENGYESPVHSDKKSTDEHYNKALELAITNIDVVELCAGTHNENSCLLLTELMQNSGIQPEDNRVWFSQLMGMRDNISYTLASLGYNVSKYLPYGPVSSTMPYLVRRARENTSISGQLGQEVRLLQKEIDRRSVLKKRN